MSVSAGNASPISGAFDAGPEAVRWGSSLLLILLLHLGIAYYLIALHHITLQEPPPPPPPLLVDLAPAAPVVSPGLPLQPVTPPAPKPSLPLPPVSAPEVPPQPVTPVLTEPLPPVPLSTPPSSLTSPPPPQPAPEMPMAPVLPDQAGPDSIPLSPPPLLRPEVAPSQPAQPQPAQSRPAQPRPAAATPPKVATQKSPQAVAAAGQSNTPAPDAIRRWQLSVIQKLHPFMHFPPSTPYWIKEASPIVRVTIDRQGNVLQADVIRTSGYDDIDHAAHRIFKRAGTLPPPPPELPGNPLTFEMTVTFTQETQ